MAEHGWTGRPIVVLDDQALTGSHRLAAAAAVGLTWIPIVEVPTEDLTAQDIERFEALRDDDERLAWLLSIGADEAAEIMRAENT